MLKPLTKLLSLLFSFSALLILTACGGGGKNGDNTSPQPQKATVTFALQDGPASVYSVQLHVVLPDGFVLETDISNQPTDRALTLLVTGAELNDVAYIPATPAINGELIAAIGKVEGFPGDASLMQISCTYAPGVTLPTVGDFMVTVDASDMNGVPLGGISEKISIVIQPAP
jgi:hypothetical protein